MPIEEYPLKASVKTGIEMSVPLQEWEAAHAANLDLHKWDSSQYPPDFMAKVIAWHSRHRELELHTQDAVQRAAKRANK